MRELITLPPRLAAIADMVPAGAGLADVGTDHGLLPIYLLQKGVIVRAVATDIRGGPLSRAEEKRIASGVSDMECRLCDGLEGVEPGEVDTVVIAGMGGDNIARILERAPWARRECLLLLQPMSRPETLRRALEDFGMHIEAERLTLDSGRVYSVLRARAGPGRRLDVAETYLGARELILDQPLFPRALAEWQHRLGRAAAGLRQSSRPEDAERLEKLSLALEQMEEMRRAYAQSI